MLVKNLSVLLAAAAPLASALAIRDTEATQAGEVAHVDQAADMAQADQAAEMTQADQAAEMAQADQAEQAAELAEAAEGGPGHFGHGHGGFRGGHHHGGHWHGGHDHDHDHPHPDPDDDFEFRIVTYEPYGIDPVYYEIGPEIGTTDEYPLYQTEDIDDSGIFVVNDDGYLLYYGPTGTGTPLIANYLLTDFDVTPAEPVPLVFAAKTVIDNSLPALTEWTWVVDYDDYRLRLRRPNGSTPYYILVCTDSVDPTISYLAVGIEGAVYDAYEDTCVATTLNISEADD